MKSFFFALTATLMTLLSLSSCSLFSREGPETNVTIWETTISQAQWTNVDEARATYFNCPIITSEVLDGNYLVSASLYVDNQFWVAAPYITAGSDYTETCQFVYNATNASLFAYSDDNVTTIHESISKCKVAVIEGLSGKKEWSIEEIEANPQLFNIVYIK